MLPAVLLGSWRLHLNRRSNDRRDPIGRRRRRAMSVARRSLKEARSLNGDADRLDALAKVTTGFVADWTGLPRAAIGVEQVREFCATVDFPEAAARLERLLAGADHVRYGGGGADDLRDAAREVETLLTELNRRRGKRRDSNASGSVVAGALLLLVLCAGAGPSPAQSPGADPARLLAEGNQAYTEGDLDTALERYREAESRGVADADLEFNLGNTYARREELGRAVAAYLRAERLDPRDRDIAENLAWVRGHIQDLELAKSSLPLFVGETAALIAYFSLDEWSLALVVLVWILAGLLGWAWWREDWGIRLRRTALATAALLILVAGVTAWRYQREEIRRQAVVIGTEVEVRSGPAESFPVLFEVHDGLTLQIESERDDWARVGLGGDWVGWVPARSLEEVRRPDSALQGR